MVAWLEGEPGSVDVDVWGVKKANYSFVDLGDWLENGGKLELDDEDEELEKHKVLKRGKGKGKEKDLEKGKGKEKKREHKKRESSRRAK